METLAKKFKDFKNFELEESKTSNLLFHLIQYYQFDIKKLNEYKGLLLTKKGVQEIINIINFNEDKFDNGDFDFKKMVSTVHKRIELLDEEESFRCLHRTLSNKNNFNLTKN